MTGVQVAALGFGFLLAAWFVSAQAIRAAAEQPEASEVYRGLPVDRETAEAVVGDVLGQDIHLIDNGD